VQVGATQIYRLTDVYGKGVADIVNAERTLSPLKNFFLRFSSLNEKELFDTALICTI
jgi:hypothetical protein